ncbi:DUF2254 domain-containing protein [Candidatus Berkiella cookevillensis]|uniref:DUF2254 domain-containing protein n=1 Tax=Candidatus Berkiella cookevillensis TaxID=437022 RepID=A0A0Q9YRU2_9GAMM|nr:DUF2254 domain-containing protein [Candidatus Berkiella cookevillensis]MCS5707649.1 DUF2254 domain-containing protein [Candidatus Berkiella cookevillensis]
MISKWQWISRQLSEKLWLRAGLFCIISVICALAGLIIKNYVPINLNFKISAEAIYDVLNIIASSMLAVTIFSLSVMITAYAAAANSATPRSTRLLLTDRTAQNALSTFIGSFLFSLVGIIALKMDIYDENGRLLLFIATIIVIFLVVLMLLRWIEYLSSLGRLGKTIDMVEKAATASIREFCKHPYLGGTPLFKFSNKPEYISIPHPKIGYIQHIDIAALSKVAEQLEYPIYVMSRPGTFNDSLQPVVYLGATTISENDIKKIQNAFIIGGERLFEQDPRFGTIVLTEIASRSLSPAINDPGTAIDVLGTLLRIFTILASASMELEESAKEIKYANVFIPEIPIEDFFSDCFSPIARDGAGMLEVGIRLQKTFHSLASAGDSPFQKAVRNQSQYALAQALATLKIEQDKEVIKSITLSS